jgi:hypothetical protein
VLIWKLHGDLEGIYVQTITYVVPPPYTVDYSFEGYATFIGTLQGKGTSWTAHVEGHGRYAYAVWAGHESWRTQIFDSTGSLSDLSGDFGISGYFDFTDATTGEPYTYSGKVRFETKKTK